MIFLPSLSILINSLIIFIAKIFRREFYIYSNTIKVKIMSYTIILMISCLTFASFIFLIKFSLTSNSNVAIIIATFKNWNFTEISHATENVKLSLTDNRAGVSISAADCSTNFYPKPFVASSSYYSLAGNYIDSSLLRLTFLYD